MTETIGKAQARLMKADILQISTEPIIADIEHLDPGATEYVELFHRDYFVYFSQEILKQFNVFELEGRARDTPTVVVQFQYAPDRSPQIMML